MIENALVTLLRAVQNNARITPGTESILVYTELPRVVYTLSTSETAYSDDGTLKFTKARYQLDVFSLTMTEGRAIISKIRLPVAEGGLDGYNGAVDSTQIDRIWFEGPNFSAGEPIPGGKTVSRFMETLNVWYRE